MAEAKVGVFLARDVFSAAAFFSVLVLHALYSSCTLLYLGLMRPGETAD
jgi:hypothetical protein